MPLQEISTPILTDAQVGQFIRDGFVRIDAAFPRALADEARSLLWRDLPCSPDDPATWVRPVVRLGMYSDAPLVAAANTPVLHAAFDRLIGAGRWLPCRTTSSRVGFAGSYPAGTIMP